jgi:queuine tRNA-ribosyltransferase
VISDEILASMISTLHNLGFYMWLMAEARKHINEGDFANWKKMMAEQVSRRL